MKAQIIQCSERPRVERNGNVAVVTFSDMNGSKVEVELEIAHVVSVSNDLAELHHDVVAARQGKVHPVFGKILQGICPA